MREVNSRHVRTPKFECLENRTLLAINGLAELASVLRYEVETGDVEVAAFDDALRKFGLASSGQGAGFEYREDNNTGVIRTPITVHSAIPEDSFEQNDALGAAAYLGSGDQTLQGLTIDRPYDDDYFAWTATADGSLIVDTFFSHSLGDLDMALYDNSGGWLDVSNSITDNERIVVDVEQGETYFIRVYGYAGATHPNYDLVLDGPEFGEIHGMKWNDRDGDGQRDSGEEGLDGWTI